jgi:hypothetical protein
MGSSTALATASGVGSREVPSTVMPGGRPVSGSILATVTFRGMKLKVRLHP